MPAVIWVSYGAVAVRAGLIGEFGEGTVECLTRGLAARCVRARWPPVVNRSWSHHHTRPTCLGATQDAWHHQSGQDEDWMRIRTHLYSRVGVLGCGGHSVSW